MRLEVATPDDAPRLLALLGRPEVAEFLRVREGGEDELRAELAAADPATGQRLLICTDEGLAGTLAWRMASHRSRLAELYEVAVAPELRGRGLAVAAVCELCRRLFAEAGVHRVQLETYGDNPAARAAFRRVGFTEEGVRRSAYWRRGDWQDGVIFGLLAEELAQAPM